MTTLHMMKHDVDDLRSAGYRRLRATTVLAAASKTIQQMQDGDLNEVLSKTREINFHIDRLEDEEVEVLFAYFDEELTQKIVDEFTFRRGLGNIRDLGGCVGVCDLCGKGDSRDDGANEDKIRYQFLLTNTAGGKDVWVGSTCIVQHGLHVDGARTAEEAEKILRQVMNAHKAQWKIDAWRAQHADHHEIPAQWEELRRTYVNNFDDEMWAALGVKPETKAKLAKRVYHHVRGRGKQTFRTASKFYARKAHLTDSKTKIWMEVKQILRLTRWAMPLLTQARQKFGYEYSYSRYSRPVNDRKRAEMLDWLNAQLEAKRKIEGEKKARRKPRKL